MFALLKILDARIAFVLSPAASAAHSLPQPFEMERQYIMRACLYTLTLAWSGLSLPLYVDLSRRAADLRHGSAATVGERRRARERIEVLLKQVHAVTLKGARMVASAVKGAPSLAFQVFLQGEQLTAWSHVIREAKTTEQGGVGITAEEKMNDLRCLLDGLKVMGWSWSDAEDVKLVGSLESSLAALELGQDLPIRSTASTTIDSFVEGSETTSLEGQREESTFSSEPTDTPVAEGQAPSPIDYASFFSPPSPPPTGPPSTAPSHPSLDMLFGNLPVFEASAHMGAASGFEGLAPSALGGGMGGLEAMGRAMGLSTEAMMSLGAALGLGGLSALNGFTGMPGPDGSPGVGLGLQGGGPNAMGGGIPGAEVDAAAAAATAAGLFGGGGGGGLKMPHGFEYGGLSLEALNQMSGLSSTLGDAAALEVGGSGMEGLEQPAGVGATQDWLSGL